MFWVGSQRVARSSCLRAERPPGPENQLEPEQLQLKVEDIVETTASTHQPQSMTDEPAMQPKPKTHSPKTTIPETLISSWLNLMIAWAFK